MNRNCQRPPTADDTEALARLRELTVAAKGTNQHTGIKEDTDNISILPDMFTAKPKKRKSERGTSRAYTLVRLKKERPDLFERVRESKMESLKNLPRNLSQQ